MTVSSVQPPSRLERVNETGFQSVDSGAIGKDENANFVICYLFG